MILGYPKGLSLRRQKPINTLDELYCMPPMWQDDQSKEV